MTGSSAKRNAAAQLATNQLTSSRPILTGRPELKRRVLTGLVAMRDADRHRASLLAGRPPSPDKRPWPPTVTGVSAKTLIPGSHPVPALIWATSQAAVLIPQLLDRGWGPFSARLPDDARGELVIGADRMQLVVDDQMLLDDTNPPAPDGWWAAVDRLDNCCVVVIVADGEMDLAHPRAGEQLATLM